MSDSFSVTIGEVDKAISILMEVAQWRHDIGQTVWLPDSLNKTQLTKGLNEENFCVGRVNGEEACSMILQWHDAFWVNAKDNEAGYIHKLCVRQKFAGRGLSKLIVAYAIEECRKRGIQFLRLDTRWENKKLCELYEAMGFVIVDKIQVGDRSLALLEMKIEPLKKSMNPIISKKSKVVILGSMPGDMSLRLNQYYANPKNHFWPIIYEIFICDLESDYDKRVDFILSHKLALWDVLDTCLREGSLDSSIKEGINNDIEKLLSEYPNIKCIILNGTKAYSQFSKSIRQKLNPDIEVIKMPSTSPTPGKNVLSYEEKLEKWSVILECIE